jgi:DNA-binding HxlR family transcriptional regulator
LHFASYPVTVAAVPGKAQGKHRSGCPVSISLEIIGDRWSLLIIRDMMVRGFCTIRDRLRKLEAKGIIVSEPEKKDRRRVNYRLTEKGIDLAPVLLELLIWGARYEETKAPRTVIEAMAKNREKILVEVRRRWEARDRTPLQVQGRWQLPQGGV